jgi:hypothetical protein
VPGTCAVREGETALAAREDEGLFHDSGGNFCLPGGLMGIGPRSTPTRVLPNVILGRVGELTPAWAAFHGWRGLRLDPPRTRYSQSRP